MMMASFNFVFLLVACSKTFQKEVFRKQADLDKNQQKLTLKNNDIN